VGIGILLALGMLAILDHLQRQQSTEIYRESYEEALRAAGQPSLRSRATDVFETYRLVFLPSFGPRFYDHAMTVPLPNIVRLDIHQSGEATGTAITLNWDGVRGRYTKTGTWRFGLSAEKASQFRDLLSSWFWQAPLDDGIHGMDGESFYLEGKRGAVWHAVMRWSPEEKEHPIRKRLLIAAHQLFEYAEPMQPNDE
jgi:hypothetical protein